MRHWLGVHKRQGRTVKTKAHTVDCGIAGTTALHLHVHLLQLLPVHLVLGEVGHVLQPTHRSKTKLLL